VMTIEIRDLQCVVNQGRFQSRPVADYHRPTSRLS
jgi:hypothetical protein